MSPADTRISLAISTKRLKHSQCVRIKQEAYERLVTLAADNGRSVTGEINWRLEQSIKK